MKKITAIFLIFLSLILFGILKLHHPSVEFDEGDYLTTFLSVHTGFPLYTTTSFLQLPGFFILTNPFLLLFGSTLPIARFSIFFYSLIGIVGVFWLSIILTEDLLLGFITTVILYATPLYIQQILTFHLDVLPNVFSVMSLLGLFLFLKKRNTFWIMFMSFFLALTIMVKIDVSLLPTIFILYFLSKGERKNLVKDISVGLLTCLITFFLISVPFGLNNIWNVLLFRAVATQKSHMDISLFFTYVFSQPFLYVVFLLGIISSILIFLVKKGNIFLLGIFLWTISTVLVLFFYHPLELHHLTILTLPTSLLLSYSIVLLTHKVIQKKYLYLMSIVFFIGIMTINIFYTPSSQGILNDMEEQAVTIIQHNSSEKDFIVSDDELLGPFSERRTPPQLTDISFVSIQAGYVTPHLFEKSIQTFHPKLILPITGRLKSIKNFDEVLRDNNYQLLDVHFPYKVYVRD